MSSGHGAQLRAIAADSAKKSSRGRPIMRQPATVAGEESVLRIEEVETWIFCARRSARTLSCMNAVRPAASISPATPRNPVTSYLDAIGPFVLHT
eukprot:3501021-Rhodomonas_salina.3